MRNEPPTEQNFAYAIGQVLFSRIDLTPACSECGNRSVCELDGNNIVSLYCVPAIEAALHGELLKTPPYREERKVT
jgi:hypothetical protein